MNSVSRGVNLAIWGTPWRPWWTYAGRDREWRRALSLALTSLMALEAGCAGPRYSDGSRAAIASREAPVACDQNNCGKAPR